VAAIAVFALASIAVFGELWERGADHTVASSESALRARGTGAELVKIADVRFEAWLVSRNARALTTAPHRLFDAPHCAPSENALAFGIPMITMGALAIPSWYASGNPILTYNSTLVLLTGIAAFAMYLLVASWTGVPAAGIAAGLLFAFHPIRLSDITHPSVWDASWTVFALFFAERLLAKGRWRDAIGLAAAIALQIGASFYPLLAAVFTAAPFGLWLLLRDRLRSASPLQLGFVLAMTGAAAAFVLGPYLGVETDTGPMQRDRFAFAPLRQYLPGKRLFPGVAVLALAGVALLAGRARTCARIVGDPRGPLLAGAVLVALVAAGPKLGPEWLPVDLYGFFSGFLPGLDAVRGVFRLGQGPHLVLSLLAGLGAAALIRASGRAAPVLGAVLVLVAGFDVLRAPAAGLHRTYAWSYQSVAPDPEALAFFGELERQGNDGPILELPLRSGPSRVRMSTRRILLNAYHGRRTSACFGSYRPPGRARLAALGRRLTEPESIRELAELGFTTAVLELPPERRHQKEAPLRRLDREARDASGLAPIHRTERRSAYALRPEDLPGE
jgi:hypothetical protein